MAKTVNLLKPCLIILSCILFCMTPILSQAYNPYADGVEGFKLVENNLYAYYECTEEDVDRYLAEYNRIPESVRGLLQKAGILIFILPYDASEPGNQTVSSTYWPTLYSVNKRDNTVDEVSRVGWITCYSELEPAYFAPEQLVYSAGCALDNIMSYIEGTATPTKYALSDAQNWQQIYNVQNADKLKKMPEIDELAALNWPLNSPSGFADAFRCYICHPDKLQEASPEVFSYMQTLIQSLDYYYIKKFELYSPLADPEKAHVAKANSELKSGETENETKNETGNMMGFLEDIYTKEFNIGSFDIQKDNRLRITITIIISATIIIIAGILIFRKIRKAAVKKQHILAMFTHPYVYTYEAVQRYTAKQNKAIPGLYVVSRDRSGQNQIGISQDMFGSAMKELQVLKGRRPTNASRIAASLRVTMYPLPAGSHYSLNDMLLYYQKYKT